MKKLLLSLLPPIFANLFRRFFQAINVMRNTSHIHGYSNEILVKTVITKTVDAKKRIVDRDILAMESFRITFAALSCRKHPETVLDFGGGAGYQYFNLCKITGKKYKWSIIETSELVNQARQNNSLNEIDFHHTLEDFRSSNVDDLDLIYCSRVLQYLPDPIEACRQMESLRATNIYISGVTLSPDSDKHQITQISQLSSNGPGPLPKEIEDHQVSYGFQLIPEDTILEVFLENYELKYRINEEPVVHIHKNKPVSYNGFFFTRREDR